MKHATRINDERSDKRKPDWLDAFLRGPSTHDRRAGLLPILVYALGSASLMYIAGQPTAARVLCGLLSLGLCFAAVRALVRHIRTWTPPQ